MIADPLHVFVRDLALGDLRLRHPLRLRNSNEARPSEPFGELSV
jgi:hypothetical protein